MSETNEPVTDRIEAIRARHTSCDYTAIDSQALADIAWLLAEVERLTDGPEVSAATGRPHPAVLKLRETRRQRDAAVARIDEIERWAIDHFGDTTEFPTDLAFAFWGMPSAAAPAPVAPDAEPTEWVWSPGDVVLDADLIAWQRDGERIHYPWLAVGQPVQRDQDITEHVTKHGGRVLVCKARGIGGAS